VPRPMTRDLISRHVAAWIGDSVDPTNPDLRATIVDVIDKGIRIRIPGSERLISFQEIIDADKVIHYFWAKGEEPVWKDYNDPDPAIGAGPINNRSYAPPLAKRLRRQIDNLYAKDDGADRVSKVLEVTEEEVFDPSEIEDARQRIVSSIVCRRGQSAFRNQLLAAYKGRCAVTGCGIEAILEAAHIVPFKGPKTNHPANGLLLRADIHTLFDLGLVALDEATMQLLVSPKLEGTEYEKYHARQIAIPEDSASQPNAEAIKQHRLQSGLGGRDSRNRS
jgi:hypothetical protein